MRPLLPRGRSFIAYLTAGDGGMEYTVESAHALFEGGVDCLEVGVPFSDPVADGPVIQEAMARALQGGAEMAGILRAVERIKGRDAHPVVLFTYANPMRAGGERFYADARSAGVDGILAVDLPPEEAREHLDACRTLGLHTVFVVTPSTPEGRTAAIANLSTGFVYYACRKGTTGVREGLPEYLERDLGRIRACTPLPVAVGFGIGSRASAAEVLKTADAFVVGSHLVDAMKRKVPPAELARLARSLDPRRPS